MFSRRDINYLKSSPYGSLGRDISHGCVRLYVEDAKWLYYYACPGTTVRVSTSEPYNPALTKALKYSMPFKTYNTLQKNFYDEAELENHMAWTVLDGADMRTGNGSNDSVIKKLPAGTPVEILQTGDPWCKVLHDKREGYIKTAYLTFIQGVMQSRADADIIRGTVYMQKAPEKGAGVMFKVPTYTSVKVLNPDINGYAYVYVWGEEGYIPKKSIIKGWGIDREQDFLY
jgi:SH3-like domain-containing protein